MDPLWLMTAAGASAGASSSAAATSPASTSNEGRIGAPIMVMQVRANRIRGMLRGERDEGVLWDSIWRVMLLPLNRATGLVSGAWGAEDRQLVPSRRKPDPGPIPWGTARGPARVASETRRSPLRRASPSITACVLAEA